MGEGELILESFSYPNDSGKLQVAPQELKRNWEVLAEPCGCWDPRLCLSLGRGLSGHWDVLGGSELLQECLPSPLFIPSSGTVMGMERWVLEPWLSCTVLGWFKEARCG